MNSLSDKEKELLARDPRPRYHNDPERIYGMPFDRFDIHFRVDKGVLLVTGIGPGAAPSCQI